MSVPNVYGPRDLPALRAWLVDQWEPERPFFMTAAMATVDPNVMGAMHEDAAAWLRATDDETKAMRAINYARHDWSKLKGATLWWVAGPMVDLLEAATREVPRDVRIEDLPVPPEGDGMVVFERTIIATATGGRSIPVDAIVFGSTKLPGGLYSKRPEWGDEPDIGVAWGEQRSNLVDAISVSSYCRADLDRGLDGDRLEAVAGTLEVGLRQGEVPYDGAVSGRTADGATATSVSVHGSWWSPLGRSDWPLGDRIDQADTLVATEDAAASFEEDRRLLAAFWTLIHQAGIAATEVHYPARPVVRRLQREGWSREQAAVQVVTLRKIERSGSADDPDEVTPSGRRKTDYQYLVSGHWRNQAWGKGRLQRRLIWIAPYTKGPEGAELHTPEKVRVWKR